MKLIREVPLLVHFPAISGASILRDSLCNADVTRISKVKLR